MSRTNTLLRSNVARLCLTILCGIGLTIRGGFLDRQFNRLDPDYDYCGAELQDLVDQIEIEAEQPFYFTATQAIHSPELGRINLAPLLDIAEAAQNGNIELPEQNPNSEVDPSAMQVATAVLERDEIACQQLGR